jgi:arabinogalactan oligomer/maltooligosaccharide transport system permease protein
MIKSYKLRRHIANTFIYIVLAVLGLIWVSPLAYLVLHSFRAGSQQFVDYLIPKEYSFENYINLFTNTETLNFPRWYLNTFVVACFSCVISTISVLMVSYAFSRLRFKSRKKFINVGMILGMFPGFMTMIAIYYLLKAMGLTQTLVALVICYSAGAGLGFQISKGFFDTIPRALDEAATLTVLRKIRFSGRLFFRCLSQSLFTQF